MDVFFVLCKTFCRVTIANQIYHMEDFWTPRELRSQDNKEYLTLFDHGKKKRYRTAWPHTRISDNVVQSFFHSTQNQDFLRKQLTPDRNHLGGGGFSRLKNHSYSMMELGIPRWFFSPSHDGLGCSKCIPSWKLRYPIPRHIWRWVSKLRQVGYVNSRSRVVGEASKPKQQGLNPTSWSTKAPGLVSRAHAACKAVSGILQDTLTHLLVFLQALNISRLVGKIGKLLENIWQYDMGVIQWQHAVLHEVLKNLHDVLPWWLGAWQIIQQ